LRKSGDNSFALGQWISPEQGGPKMEEEEGIGRRGIVVVAVVVT